MLGAFFDDSGTHAGSPVMPSAVCWARKLSGIVLGTACPAEALLRAFPNPTRTLSSIAMPGWP